MRDGDGVSSAGEIDVTLFWWLATLCCGNPVTLFWWLVTLCWTPRAGNCGRAFVTSGWGKWRDPKFEESWRNNFTVNSHITVFFYEFHYGFLTENTNEWQSERQMYELFKVYNLFLSWNKYRQLLFSRKDNKQILCEFKLICKISNLARWKISWRISFILVLNKLCFWIIFSKTMKALVDKDQSIIYEEKENPSF